MSAFDRSRFDWYPTITYNGVTYTASKVVSSSGTPRPALQVPLKTLTIHYGGAGQWLDPGDTAQELAAIERNHAIPQKKPNEYNSASDSDELTWEWAGPFRAAHSAGENDWAWGHLVVMGLEMPTPAQADKLIAGIRKFRAQAVAAGHLTPDHVVLPHRQMPGASTACPGPLYENKDWWGRITAPLATTPPPVNPPGADMFHPVAKYRNSDTRVYPVKGLTPNKDHEFGLDPKKIPVDAVAALMNVVAVPAGEYGWLDVRSAGTPFAGTSTVNYNPTDAIANEVIVPVKNLKFIVRCWTTTHVVVDVSGYWSA